MRKFALVFSLLVALAANVHAGSIAPLVLGQNNIDFHNKEVTLDAAGNQLAPGSILAAGDQVFGIIRLDATGPNGNVSPINPPTLGIFDVVVQAIVAESATTNRVYFSPGTLLQTIDPSIPAGPALAFYNETSNAPYSNAILQPGNIALSIAPGATSVSNIATDAGASRFGAFGFVYGGAPAAGPPTAANLAGGYWISEPITSPPLIVPAFPPAGGSFNIFFGTNLDQTWPGAALNGVNIIKQNNSHTPADDFPGLVYDLVGTSKISNAGGGSDNGFPLISADPADINIAPEPGAIVIWSLGALGLCIPAVRRRLKIGK
jgi:hypothetical protein